MKQLETKNLNTIWSLLSFYKDIGVELSIHENYLNKFKKKEEIDAKFELVGDEKIAFEVASSAKDIKGLQNLFKNYEGCYLKKTATNFVEWEGNTKSKILIIDGPPGSAEDKEGKSFVGTKGVLFDKILNSIDLKRDDVFIAKAIPWRPPGNRYPTHQETNICRPFIFNLIKFLNPKIIVCLGEVSTNQILDLNKSIIKTRGKWYSLRSDYPIYNLSELQTRSYVLPTLGISYLLIRPEMKRQVWEDMKLLRDKIKEIT